jgi:hypothetical protein
MHQPPEINTLLLRTFHSSSSPEKTLALTHFYLGDSSAVASSVSKAVASGDSQAFASSLAEVRCVLAILIRWRKCDLPLLSFLQQSCYEVPLGDEYERACTLMQFVFTQQKKTSHSIWAFLVSAKLRRCLPFCKLHPAWPWGSSQHVNSVCAWMNVCFVLCVWVCKVCLCICVIGRKWITHALSFGTNNGWHFHDCDLDAFWR